MKIKQWSDFVSPNRKRRAVSLKVHGTMSFRVDPDLRDWLIQEWRNGSDYSLNAVVNAMLRAVKESR